MSGTKGPSNRYGNTRGTPTEHINYPYAMRFNRNTIDAHLSKHKREVCANSRVEYEAKAVTFANNVDRINHVSFIDNRGTTHKYSIATGEYAAIRANGIVITYFKPTEGLRYYEKEADRYGR